VGLGLTFDEFGMWLRLQDDYWSRLSYDAIIVISLFFINIVYFYSSWSASAGGANGGSDGRAQDNP
jgi:hypothetical protein